MMEFLTSKKPTPCILDAGVNLAQERLGVEKFSDSFNTKPAHSPYLTRKERKLMLNQNDGSSNKFTVRFRIIRNNKSLDCVVKGRPAETLFHLHKHGKRGITAAEMGGWAYRLASYVHKLRWASYHLEISTKKELHKGGFHARYFLDDAVEIISVTYPKD
jgi:hypothetical protein